jgi:hypothetical protein
MTTGAGRKASLDGHGVARRGSSSLDMASSIAPGDKGAEHSSANVKGTARELHSVARPNIDPTEDVPAPRRPSLLNRVVAPRSLAVREAMRGSAQAEPIVAANARGGALAVAPLGDMGRQRLERSVRLPQPKGAGGWQPPRGVDRHLPSCAERTMPKPPRRKTVASEDEIGSANCATHPLEADTERRCRTRSQATCARLARP